MMLELRLSRDRFLGRALLASLIIHGIIAFVIPPLASAPGPLPIETISFDRVHRIEIERAAPPPVQRASMRPKRIAQLVIATHMVQKPTAIKRSPHAVTTAPPALIAAAPVAPAIPAPIAVPSGVPSTPAPQPRASAIPAPRQIANTASYHVAGGYMPFGADEPQPVLDPNARRQLQQLNIHVTLTVVVSDDGKTKSIRFEPPIDPQLEAQIQTLLASAAWDPAYCGGGIPCEMAATIKL
jgi:hypothetical protein